MTKKHFIIFMSATLLVLLLSILGIIYAFNLPVRIGVMTAYSGTESIIPISNILEYNTSDKKETLRPLELTDIKDTLPVLDCTEYGLTTNYTEDTFDDFRFTLYNEKLAELYTGRGTYTTPEEAGAYIVKVEFSWGTSKNKRVRAEHFFKVLYN